jgi:hypothetical protein
MAEVVVSELALEFSVVNEKAESESERVVA